MVESSTNPAVPGGRDPAISARNEHPDHVARHQAIVPAQRHEPPRAHAMLERDRHGRFIKRSPFGPLPDLAGCLAAVPGGLGVQPAPSAPFVVAGITWTPLDAQPDATPIGLHLAWEAYHSHHDTH